MPEFGIKPSFWLAFAPDGSIMIPFREEIHALRRAQKENLQVARVQFGDDLKDQIIVDAEVIEEDL